MGMRAVIQQVPESLLEERRRAGADVRDEMWNGVLHMIAMPSTSHQGLGGDLYLVLAPIAKQRGLKPFYETAVHRPGADKDYRVPDLVFAKPEHVSARGIEGRAELAIEILSPDDETYEKLPFYEQVGVQELLVIDPATRRLDMFVLRGGKLLAALPDESKALRSAALDVTFRTVEGPKLEVSCSGGVFLV